MISELLGVPYEDAEFFQHHANVGLARYATGEDTVKGAMSLHKYLAQLVEAKMENPSEDAVSDLAERVKAGELSVKEAAQLGTGLLIAGHETTANMIGLGVLALLENPEQLAVLRDADDPEGHRQRRRGTAALPLHHPERPAPSRPRGHRDRRRDHPRRRGHHHRPGPGELGPACLRRAGPAVPASVRAPTSNVAFGYGRHQCVGQQLARAELQIVFPTLFRRIPTLELAIPFEEVPFKHDRLAYGVYELPVHW